MKLKLQLIYKELSHHAPFTFFGTLLGMVFVLLGHGLPKDVAHNVFYVLHPAHVFLSAIATASIYQVRTCSQGSHRCNFLILLLIGYVGSVGISTLSDSLIPYAGERILNLPHSEAHIGFLEGWWVVNPLAIAGILIAYFKPAFKVSHTGHVVLSTWASLFHIMMALGDGLSAPIFLGIFVFLFLAVWLPCCLSDIIFPLLFVGSVDTDSCSH